jgi:DNA-binding response OmpR family regulator
MTNQSVFITDDDQTFVEMIQDILKDVGYRHVTWHVGAGAFHRIREIQPGLVLLDINLGNPTRGWSTLDALALHPNTHHIPVIICSTDMHMINEKADMLRELGCQTLEKPFDLETLLDRVALAIGPPTVSV